MTISTTKENLVMVLAIVGSAIFCVLTYVSSIIFPGPFSPLENNLSQLGNSTLNPAGAFYFNLALMVAGTCLFPFYAFLYLSYRKSDGNRKLMIAVFFGIINALSVMMAGVFSEDFYAIHFFWSLMIFATWIPILFTTNFVLLNQDGLNRLNSFYGFGVGLFDTFFVGYVLVFGTGTGAILEWISVFSYMAWVILLAFATIVRARV